MAGRVLGMATTVVKPPAARRRARAQVLLIRLAGVPEVDVGVDEAGGRNQPVGLEDPGAARGKRGAGLRDAALPDQQVSDLTGPLGGVDQRGMAQQQAHGESAPFGLCLVGCRLS